MPPGSFWVLEILIKKKNVEHLEHVYMIPEVNSNRFESSNCFEMSFRLHGNLHGDFIAVTFQTIARLSTRRAQLSVAAKVVRPTDILNNVKYWFNTD